MTNNKTKYNLSELQEKARSGDHQNQYELGRLLIEGEQTKKNTEEGIKWLTLSAEQDNADALLLLGEQSVKGEGVPKDLKSAFTYYMRASKLEHPDANYKLGLFLIYNASKMNEGEALVRKAATNNHANAQYELALLYLNGVKSTNDGDSISADYQEAIRWFEKAASNGHLQSYNELGYLYAKGSSDNTVNIKIRPNEAEAIKNWTKAAEHGDAEAEYNLAIMYAKKAVGLWQSSAEKGVRKSQYMLKLVTNFEW